VRRTDSLTRYIACALSCCLAYHSVLEFVWRTHRMIQGEYAQTTRLQPRIVLNSPAEGMHVTVSAQGPRLRDPEYDWAFFYLSAR
jgi:hypothetical protein